MIAVVMSIIAAGFVIGMTLFIALLWCESTFDEDLVQLTY